MLPILSAAFGEMPYSSYFSLADMSRSGAPYDNTPTGNALENLKSLGSALDSIYRLIGPFSIESAYRTPQVQAWLKSGGAGIDSMLQAATNSFHTQGMAADITPWSMSAADYYAKIITDPTIRNMFGEIALKNNTLHLSLPGAGKVGVPMIVENGSYIRYSVDEALKKIGRAGEFIAENKIAFGVAAVGVALFVALMLAARRQNA